MSKLSIVDHGRKMESAVEFSRYFSKIRQNIWRILLVVVVTALVAYPLVRLITSKYVATSVLMIKALKDDATPLPQMTRYDSTRSDYYETQYSIAGSRVVLEQAITTLGLAQDPTFNGGIAADHSNDQNAAARQSATLKNLVNGLTISGVRNTQLIDVSFESPDAETAARVANGVAQAYIDYTEGQKQKAIEEAQGWNQQQMDKLRQQMDAQKADIDAYLKKEGLLTFRGVDGYETEQLGIVTNRLADATQKRIAAESLRDLVQRALAKHSLDDVISIPDFSGHAQIQDLRISLTQTSRNLAELRKRYGPKHEKILEAQAEVAAVNNQISRVLSELARGASQDYQAALDDESRYKAMLGQQKGNFQQLAGKRDQYNSMMTALNKTEELYQSIYQRAHEQALAVSLKQPDAVITDPAAVPERPAKPNKALLLIIIVVLMTLLYVAWLIVSAALDNTINSMSQLGRRLLTTRVLGEIPQFDGDRGRDGLITQLFSDADNADIIHSIRTNLLLIEPSPQVLVIASDDTGEGRSLLASALGRSFSADQKTLVVDLDYVSDNGLSDDNMPGLADVIQGHRTLDEVLIHKGDNLHLLPRGKLSGSTFLMLTSRQMAALLETLRGRYQRIIIDTPGFQQSQDGQLIGRQGDGVLLVVQAGRSQANSLLKMCQALSDSHNTITGAVINQVLPQNLESKEGLRGGNAQLKGLITPVKKPGKKKAK